MDGFAIFHQIVTPQEAVVPLERRNALSYALAYNNTGGEVLGVAVANVSAQQAPTPLRVLTHPENQPLSESIRR